MEDNTKHQLGEALLPVSEHYAQLAVDPVSQLSVYPASFLNSYQIFRIERRQRHRPVLFFVGFAPGLLAYLLTANPDDFVKMAQADHVVIGSVNAATEYARAYLEVTRNMSQLFYLVQSVDDLRFRPNLNNDEQQEKASFLERFSSVIQAPRGTEVNGSYNVIIFAVREQALERHAITIGGEGSVSQEISTIEGGLPLVYGL